MILNLPDCKKYVIMAVAVIVAEKVLTTCLKTKIRR